MKIYIDTNTFPATPGIYADAEKTKPLPRVIPLVQGFRGTVQIAFLGELAPKSGDGVTLAMRPFGARRDILVTQTVAASTDTGEDGVSAVAEINLAVNTDALTTALSDRETLNLLCGVVVTDDNAAFPTRVEWQLVFAVSASALANGVPPDISPAAAEKLREELESVKTDLSENYVDKSSAQTILGLKTFKTGDADVNTGGGLLVGRLANDGSEGLWRFDGEGLRLEAIRSGGGFLTTIGPNGVSADSVRGRYLCGTFIRSVSSLADGSLGGLISVPHVPADTPVGQETLALKSDIAAAVVSVYKFKGTVVTEADLPTSGNAIGDVWNVNDTGKNFAWDGVEWDSLGGDVEYTTLEEVKAFVMPSIFALERKTTQNASAITFKADESALKSKVSAIVVQSGTDTDEGNLYGWRGDLWRLGVWGGAVSVESITIKRGTGGNNTRVALWARLLRQQADLSWQIVSQAKYPLYFDDAAAKGELTWEMQAVEGVVPPSADDHVAIVFVNDPAKQADASDGALRFSVVEDVSGGIMASLPQSNPTAMPFSPWFKIGFAPLAGADKAATRDELESALERLSTLEERILAIENA